VLIVSGHLRLRPGSRDAFVEAAGEAMTLARAAPGCHDFVVAADPLDPDRVNVYERWASATELEAFRGEGPSSDAMSSVVSGDVSRYEIASVGPA
jgi:quinol monooxygenase YgiN